MAFGEFLQAKWNDFLEKTGDDPFLLWFIGTNVVVILVYWIVGGLYTILDVTQKPSFLRKYKVQPNTNEPVDPTKLRKCIKQVLINQLCVNTFVELCVWPIVRKRNFTNLHVLPSLPKMAAELLFCLIIEEIGFYYSHRLLHSRYLYKTIHRQHHEWKAPIAISAMYCHPIENIFSNVVPLVIGPVIAGCHIVTFWLFFSFALIFTLSYHSGYHFPFFLSPELHDYHHLTFNQCYGVFGFMDWLHGTDKQFRSHKVFERHTFLMSTLSAREIFPDPIKKVH